MTDEKPYIKIEATYSEGARNNMDVRLIDTNTAMDNTLYHQMYDQVYEAAKILLERTKKGRLELKLTFFD